MAHGCVKLSVHGRELLFLVGLRGTVMIFLLFIHLSFNIPACLGRLEIVGCYGKTKRRQDKIAHSMEKSSRL